jgi:hypothetical protein
MIMQDLSNEQLQPHETDLVNDLVFQGKNKQPNLNQVLNECLPSESSIAVESEIDMSPAKSIPKKK